MPVAAASQNRTSYFRNLLIALASHSDNLVTFRAADDRDVVGSVPNLRSAIQFFKRTHMLKLFTCFLVCAVTLGKKVPPSTPGLSTHVVSVSASSRHLALGYLSWLHEHPELRPGSGKGLAQPGKSGEPYKIEWPTLDIYDQSGNAIYHGNDSRSNVAVIERLPAEIPRLDSHVAALRPSLQEAEGMFPELKTVPLPVGWNNYPFTIFVIDYGARPQCRDQDQAIQKLKSRLQGSRLRLIEIRIPEDD